MHFSNTPETVYKLIAKDRRSRYSHFFFTQHIYTLHWWINLYKEDTVIIRMYASNGWRMPTNFVDQQHQPKRFFKSIVLRKWPRHTPKTELVMSAGLKSGGKAVKAMSILHKTNTMFNIHMFYYILPCNCFKLYVRGTVTKFHCVHIHTEWLKLCIFN